MRSPRIAAVLSFAAAVSLASVPVQAAPLTALSAAAKPAAQDTNVTQVRWGGWHGGWHGGGIGFGIGALAAGALIGAAVTSPYYYGGYYPYYGGYPAYYGGYYSYGYPYAYSTVTYPANSYGYYRPYYRHYAYRHHWRHSYAMYRVHHYRH